MKVLAKNKRANFDYDIGDKLVAGLVLTGAEVKSIKAGHISLKGSFIALRNNEAFLTNAHVTPYAHSHAAENPTRSRKLLLHRKQLDQLTNHKSAGTSAVPLAVVLDHNLVKLEIGLGKGKKRYDKRETIKQREVDRDIARRLKG
jgi:SsrA-binding protein